MVQTAPTTIIDTFETFIYRDENRERSFELIAGEIVEVVSNNYSSEIAARIIILIGAYVLQHKLGRITGADGGYHIGEERYIPDVAFISVERQPEPSKEAYNPNPPDLAVEVLSPTDDMKHVRLKVANYAHAGTTLWIIDPEAQTVEVYAPNANAIVYELDDTLDGGKILPDFKLPVKDIFAR